MNLFAALSRFLKWLGASNIFISIAAASACFSTFVFIGHSVDFVLIAATFFATLMIYNVQRLVSDAFYKRHIRPNEIIYGSLGLAGAVPFFFLLSQSQQVLLGLAGLISLAYALPFIPSGSRYIALREIPYLKIWIIVAVWVLVTVLSPFFSLPIELLLDPDSIVWFIHQGMFVFALTIPFDLRDLKTDDPNQKTIPMVFGKRNAIRIAQAALIASGFLALAMYNRDAISLGFCISQAFLSLVSIAILNKGTTERNDSYYLIVLDGLIILQGLLLIPWMPL